MELENVILNGLEVPKSAADAYNAARVSCIARAKQRGLMVNCAALPNPLPSVDLLRLHTILLSAGVTQNLCTPTLFSASRGQHHLLSKTATEAQKLEHLLVSPPHSLHIIVRNKTIILT